MSELTPSETPSEAPPLPEAITQASRRPSPLLIAGVVAIAVASAWSAIAVYHFGFVAPRLTKIGVVDMLTVYREKEAQFAQAIMKDGATQAERDAAMASATEFAKSLPSVLAQISAECGCVVLAGNAVADRHNAIDLTGDLRKRLGL